MNSSFNRRNVINDEKTRMEVIGIFLQWAIGVYAQEDDDQFVYRVHVADYVILKAAWQPRLLTGAQGVRASRWNGHGLPWRSRFLARCAAAVSFVALLSLQR